jgi:ParB family transcriptional regulator, chromosome partitioning protein
MPGTLRSATDGAVRLGMRRQTAQRYSSADRIPAHATPEGTIALRPRAPADPDLSDCAPGRRRRAQSPRRYWRVPKRDLTRTPQAAGADLGPRSRGRGLAGWLGEPAGSALTQARRLPLDRIDVNPQQARQAFDEDALEELASSMRAHGVLQPIGVLRQGERYQIVFGERRYRAARRAALPDIPALVYDDLAADDAAILSALENLQRADLDLEEEARQFARLLEVTGLSQRALAANLGKTHNYVSRRLRLLHERPELFAAIRAGRITQRAALGAVADDAVYHGDTPAGRTPRAGGQTGAAARWPALTRAQRALGELAAAAVPAADRPALLQELAQLETQLETLRRALERRPNAAPEQEV